MKDRAVGYKNSALLSVGTSFGLGSSLGTPVEASHANGNHGPERLHGPSLNGYITTKDKSKIIGVMENILM